MNVCKGGSFYFLGVKERKRMGEKVESVGGEMGSKGSDSVRGPVWFQRMACIFFFLILF